VVGNSDIKIRWLAPPGLLSFVAEVIAETVRDLADGALS
jgi:hypothetical protein